MARSLGRLFRGFQSLGSISTINSQHSLPTPSLTVRTTFVRGMVALPSPFNHKPRDFSLPNSSWGPEMMQLYEHYNSLCEVVTEGGEKQRGPWKRMPGYDRILKYPTGGVYLSKIIQSKARLFTRSHKEPGAFFEYALFLNGEEQRCVGIFQTGHLLEGAPGHVHGGAIATMIDTAIGALANFLIGFAMTANININYRSPIPLGSTLLIQSSLDKREGRKLFLTCKVTNSDGSKLYTETTALFISINGLSLLMGV